MLFDSTGHAYPAASRTKPTQRKTLPNGFFWAIYTKTRPLYPCLDAFQDSLSFPTDGISEDRLQALLAVRARLHASLVIPSCFAIELQGTAQCEPL
jgi:hypothetical protein